MRREVKEKLWLIPAAICIIAGLICGFMLSWKAMCVHLVLNTIGDLCHYRYKKLTGSVDNPCECTCKEEPVQIIEIPTVEVPIELTPKVIIEKEVAATPVHTKPKKKTTKKVKKTVKE